jgi:hypothetical protein
VSRFSAVFLAISAGEYSWQPQLDLVASIARYARASSFNEACAAVSRLVRLALDFRQTMYELESLDQAALRELKICRADFRSIAWSEARRQCLEKALNVTPPLQR